MQNLHTKLESTVCQAQTAISSNQGVPVSLTIQLTRSKGIGPSGRFDHGASSDSSTAE